jgi:hypothetical protein
MMGPSRCVVVYLAFAVACSAGDNSIDPGDLELRDLLGISPDAASAWSDVQRAAARRVLVSGLSEADLPTRIAREPELARSGLQADEQVESRDAIARIADLLATGDSARAADGAEPFGVVHIALAARELALTPQIAPRTVAAIAGAATALDPPSAELWLAERWQTERASARLRGPSLRVLATLAADAGHPGGPVLVVPAPRLAVIAAYVAASADMTEPQLAVNPVLLAALEAEPDELATISTRQRWALASPAGAPGAPQPLADPLSIASTGGNPYSFYGSVEECAFAQRTRCEACLAGDDCAPITDAADANIECTTLAANDGRGYFLLCINLSLAITSVESCTADAAPACPRDPGAASSLASLEDNAAFLTDSTCAGALERCLAKIYGAPREPFPGVDGGSPPATPPRSTNVSCDDSCDTDTNNNCSASPSCDCTGPSCNNSLSCDSACSSSNDQSGCGGNCNACTSSGGGGGGGGEDSCGGDDGGSSGGGCGGDDGGSSGGGCGGDDGGSSGDGCGGDGSSGGGDCGGDCGSSGDGSCGGDSCSGGSGGGDSCGGDCGSSGGGDSCGGSSGGCSGGGDCGSGGSKCSTTRSNTGSGLALLVSMTWAVLPIPFAALVRRRARRRKRTGVDADLEHDVDSCPTAGRASDSRSLAALGEETP